MIFRSVSSTDDGAAPGAFEVERAALALGGGQLWTSPFVFDPSDIDLRVTVFARRISLQRWLPVVSRKKARGSGVVSGQVAFRLRTEPQLQVTIDRGHLRAEGRGHIAVADRPALRRALQRYAQDFDTTGAGTSEMIENRIVGALEDFGYRTLEATIVRTEDGSLLRLVTAGRGRRVPQELDLSVNVTGFDNLINPAIRAWLAP